MTRGHALGAAIAMATAALAPTAARADATASMAVTNLRVHVVATAPGQVAAVSFAGAGGSTAQGSAATGMPPAGEDVSCASHAAFGQATAATSPNAFVGASAALAGDVFGAGGAVRTSAFAVARGPGATGQGTVGLVDGVSSAFFTLAPHTRMTISADVEARAATTGASVDEVADSGLSFSLADATGAGPQFARFTFDAWASGLFGAGEDVETTVVDLSYENDTDAEITGLFSGYVSSYAFADDPVSPVPEPGGAGMLVVGALLLAGVARGVRRLRA